MNRTLLAVLAIVFAAPGWCDVVDFESFSDGDIVTNQIPGFTFTNTEVLTAGVSLNEIDFPPHSGTNVAFDNGGPITIAFATPATGFLGYFTYTVPLTITGFNASHSPVISASSLFSSDLGQDELLKISFAAGISSVMIKGDPAGGSFTMDDIQTTPEPNTVAFLLVVLAALGCQYWRRRRI